MHPTGRRKRKEGKRAITYGSEREGGRQIGWLDVVHRHPPIRGAGDVVRDLRDLVGADEQRRTPQPVNVIGRRTRKKLPLGCLKYMTAVQ